MIMAFGFCFETPVLLSLLAYAGLVSSEGLKKKRKYAIVVVFLIAAFMTPPDPFTQAALAIPVLLLYELSIWIIKGIESRREDDEFYDDEEFHDEFDS